MQNIVLMHTCSITLWAFSKAASGCGYFATTWGLENGNVHGRKYLGWAMDRPYTVKLVRIKVINRSLQLLPNNARNRKCTVGTEDWISQVWATHKAGIGTKGCSLNHFSFSGIGIVGASSPTSIAATSAISWILWAYKNKTCSAS